MLLLSSSMFGTVVCKVSGPQGLKGPVWECKLFALYLSCTHTLNCTYWSRIENRWQPADFFSQLFRSEDVINGEWPLVVFLSSSVFNQVLKNLQGQRQHNLSELFVLLQDCLCGKEFLLISSWKLICFNEIDNKVVCCPLSFYSATCLVSWICTDWVLVDNSWQDIQPLLVIPITLKPFQ